MQEGTSAAEAPQAYTDLYDEQRSRFLVQYPPLLIILLGLGGVVAILITGFLGYSRQTDPRVYPGVESFFHEPWLLFFWFCALMVTVQWSIFRHPSLTRQRVQTLIATGVSIVVVILGYYFRNRFADIGTAIYTFFQAFHLTVDQNFLLGIINYGIITIFWADSARRWVRRAQNKPFEPQVPIGLPNRSATAVRVVPSLQELVSGDFIAGGVLTAALWGIFQPESLRTIASWFNGGSSSANFPSDYAFADRNQMLVYFFIGLLLLAFTALLNGFVALNAVSRQIAPQIAIGKSDETGTDKGTKGVVQTLIETILGIFSRFGRNLLGTFLIAVRSASWPFLVLLATAGLAVAARYLQYYLHGSSCGRAASNVISVSCDYYSSHGHSDTLALGGDAALVALSLAIAILGIIGGAALLVFQVRVVTNTLRFLQLVGLLVLLTFWLFTLALASLNILLTNVFNATPRQPFLPGLGTLVSVGALVVYGVIFFVGRARRGDRTPLILPRARRPVAVAATSAAEVPVEVAPPATPTTLSGEPVQPKDESS